MWRCVVVKKHFDENAIEHTNCGHKFLFCELIAIKWKGRKVFRVQYQYRQTMPLYRNQRVRG